MGAATAIEAAEAAEVVEAATTVGDAGGFRFDTSSGSSADAAVGGGDGVRTWSPAGERRDRAEIEWASPEGQDRVRRQMVGAFDNYPPAEVSGRDSGRDRVAGRTATAARSSL